MGPPAHVDAERPPGERRLEDPLSEIPGKEQLVRPPSAEGREKPQLRDADVLRLVDHAEVERWMRSLCHLHRQPREHAGLRQLPLFGEGRPDPREDRPEQLPLLLGQPGLAAEPLHVTVVLPTRELPGVDHRAPFRPEEVRTETMAFDTRSRLPEQLPDVLVRRRVEAAETGRVEAAPDAAHRIHFQTLGDLRFVPDEALEARPKRDGQRLGEGGQQHAALRMCSRQMHRPVERHDGLAGAGRARDARRAAVLPFDELPLGRVQEDRPLLPGVVQRSLQRVHIRHHPEAALRVRVRERIGARDGRRRTVGRTAGRKLQQRLGGLARQVIGEVEQRVLRRGPHVVQPLDRHAVAEQIVVRRAGEDRGPRRCWPASHRVLAGRRNVHLYIPWHLNLADRLADLDELRSSRRRMPFQSPSFGPLIGGVVMIDVAEQEAGSGPVDDEPDVATDPRGPEVLVLRPVDLVQLQARMRRVHLQVERRGLDRLLLVAGQPDEAVGEGVGDTELHHYGVSASRRDNHIAK